MLVESEDADNGEEQAVHHAQAGSEIVQLLGDVEVASVEDHAEGPARETAVSEANVVFAQSVADGHLSLQLRHSPVVCEEVEEREEDAGWLLYAGEAVERPFAVELEDRLKIWWVAGKARMRGDVLTCVIALGGAVPEEETVVEGCRRVQFMLLSVWCVCSYEWTGRRRRNSH